ncbi:MAG: hypothetical protein EOP02_16450 [Proteobacteria bacterium]|nr:MAG: hypothetical protein EOP02_16450 [Pseudomonadota bacterium]
MLIWTISWLVRRSMRAVVETNLDSSFVRHRSCLPRCSRHGKPAFAMQTSQLAFGMIPDNKLAKG